MLAVRTARSEADQDAMDREAFYLNKPEREAEEVRYHSLTSTPTDNILHKSLNPLYSFLIG